MSVPSLPTFDHTQRLALGIRFPARMTVLPLGGGQLALVSPVPIDDACAAAIARLGEVALLIAPNLMHHLYLGDAARRYPAARVLAPAGLVAKRSDLRVDVSLDGVLPAELTQAVDVLRLEGAPRLDEFVFHHRAARSLVVTELVFNILHPPGFLAHVLLAVSGTRGRLASSRLWRTLVEDRARFVASLERVLALPFETLVVAHGELVTDDARAQLAQALRWILPEQNVVAAPAR